MKSSNKTYGKRGNMGEKVTYYVLYNYEIIFAKLKMYRFYFTHMYIQTESEKAIFDMLL